MTDPYLTPYARQTGPLPEPREGWRLFTSSPGYAGEGYQMVDGGWESDYGDPPANGRAVVWILIPPAGSREEAALDLGQTLDRRLGPPGAGPKWCDGDTGTDSPCVLPPGHEGECCPF